jgi:hypothetical protein
MQLFQMCGEGVDVPEAEHVLVKRPYDIEYVESTAPRVVSNPLGDPPALPGRQWQFDSSGMRAGHKTPHPAAHGRHPLPTGEGRESLSFSLGEKVAEGRGRMRGLFPTVALRPL